MKKENLYILGAGGMGREILTYYSDQGFIDSVKGFVEQHSTRAGQLVRAKKILDESELPKNKTDTKLIAGIGNPMKKRWIEELESSGYCFDTLIHERAYVGESVNIGEGSIICPGAILTCDISLGKHCIVNLKASISHDCEIGDYVTVSPGATIGGRVVIGDETWIGMGATVIQDVKIGKRVFIAAGAVVVDDIPDDCLVMGVPAKVVRKLTPESWKHLM